MSAGIDPDDAARFEREYKEMLYKVIAVMATRLGGKVVIDTYELQNMPTITLKRDFRDRNITIEVEEK